MYSLDMGETMTDLMTAEQLESIEIPGKWTELVRGQLIVREPPSTYHGKISATILFLIAAFTRPRGLGAVFGQDIGFKIESDPDTVRAPDVAFLNRERSARVGKRGYSAVAPNLAVEVLSPGDRPSEVLEKVAAWLSAGVELAWVVDPERREVRVHRADGSIAVLASGDRLSGETVLPGFACAVTELFE